MENSQKARFRNRLQQMSFSALICMYVWEEYKNNVFVDTLNLEIDLRCPSRNSE